MSDQELDNLLITYQVVCVCVCVCATITVNLTHGEFTGPTQHPAHEAASIHHRAFIHHCVAPLGGNTGIMAVTRIRSRTSCSIYTQQDNTRCIFISSGSLNSYRHMS